MKVQLSPSVIAALYKDTLVITGRHAGEKPTTQVTDKKDKAATDVPPPVTKWYLGDNRQHVVIVVNDDSAVHIADEYLGTLGKLLTACGLTLADVAIVNFARQPRQFTDLKKQLGCTQLLLFNVGTQDIELPFTIPHYQVQQYSGTTIMTAPVTTLSAGNTEAVKKEKRYLWDKLKIIFNV